VLQTFVRAGEAARPTTLKVLLGPINGRTFVWIPGPLGLHYARFYKEKTKETKTSKVRKSTVE
jgi:hypothetical protein